MSPNLQQLAVGDSTTCHVQSQSNDTMDDCLSMSGQSLRHAILSDVPSTLRELSLASNQLTFVDIAPLAHCEDLESLVLNGNALESIDLRPLASCSKLQKLWLHNNSLTSIDLAPLSSCSKLRALYLDGNRIDSVSVQLAPLENCSSLRSLRLGRNELAGELDVSPVLSCMSLTMLDVSASVRLTAFMPSELSARPAPNALPPALRRKAANINWQTAEDDLKDLDDTGFDAELKLLNSPQSGTDLTALLLGFKGNSKYAMEGLLEEHANMKILSISSVSPDLTPAAVVSAGALRTCHVILLRGSTEAMVQGLRSLDKSIPIFVVRNTTDGIAWDKNGATGVLSEPLLGRDAITIRRHAWERVRAINRIRNQSCLQLPSACVLDVDNCAMFPTSPVTSSESSPPTGVPTNPYDMVNFGNTKPRSFSRSRLEEKSSSLYSKKTPTKTSRIPKKSRWTGLTKSSSLTARVEDSGLSMTFSRHGGVLRREDFHTVASICGLPLCLGCLLFDAVMAWTQLRQVSTNPSAAGRHSSFRRIASACWGPGEVVSYEQFKLFWDGNLRSLDSEQRLFTITSLANGLIDHVSIDSLTRITCDFIRRRNSSYEEVSSDSRSSLMTVLLAEKIIWYNLHGCLRSRLTRTELSRLAFCSSLLAAENGVYNGVTSHLRTDRLRGIFTAFEEACNGDSLSGDLRVSMEKIMSFNAARGLLCERAVKAHFDLFPGAENCGLSVAEFAPMWLAINDLSSSAASNYFFRLLDVDQDGYVGACDVMHFYSEKYAMLVQDGFVPVEFVHIWQSILDNLKDTRSSGRYCNRLVSLSELHSICERERVLFWQSVLFLQDDLSTVNITETVAKGSPQAAKVACSAFG